MPDWDPAQLLKDLRPGVERYVRRLLRNAEHSDDVIQETCLRFLKNPPAEPVHDPIGYLRGIAWRVAGTLYGKERTYQQTLKRFASESELARNSPLLPDARVENGHFQRAVANALRKLPPRHRRYLSFHMFHGMSRADAARAAGLSPAAAAKAHSRALEKLAHLLRHWRPLNLRNGDKP